MAARRLIIVLVLLLAASIVAATVAPDRTGRLVGVTDTTTSTEETSTTTSTAETTTSTSTATSTPTPTPAPAPAPAPTGDIGEALSARIDASVKEPETVRAAVGDQLALAVASTPPRSIAIPSLGLTEFAGEDAPAHFNLLLRAPGTYPITDGDDPGLILGRIVVRKPDADGATKDREDRRQRQPQPAG